MPEYLPLTADIYLFLLKMFGVVALKKMEEEKKKMKQMLQNNYFLNASHQIVLVSEC